MLALRDSNQLVIEFGCSEVVGPTALPVYFGATTLGYRDRIEDLVARIAEAGFHGVTNFPSCVFLGGQFLAASASASMPRSSFCASPIGAA